MQSNLLENTVADVLSEALSEATGDLYVVNPSAETIEELVDTLGDADGPEVRVLASRDTLKDVMDDFLVASRAADLVEADRLALRSYEEAGNTLLVTEDAVVAVVSAGDRVAGLATDDEAFIESAYDRFAGDWEDSEPFGLRTPPLSRVRETIEADIGPETAADFDAVLNSLETARGDGDGLDEVTISLLVAARNEGLLYDISKWGEDVGIASKATFSRTKTRMEEAGLIETEKVPIDVGRPRLRLKLAEDSLRNSDISGLVNAAQTTLAA